MADAHPIVFDIAQPPVAFGIAGRQQRPGRCRGTGSDQRRRAIEDIIGPAERGQDLLQHRVLL